MECYYTMSSGGNRLITELPPTPCIIWNFYYKYLFLLLKSMEKYKYNIYFNISQREWGK